MLVLRRQVVRAVATVILAITLPACARTSPAAPGNNDAVVDLRAADFSAGAILVPTKWDFYWKRHVEPRAFAAGDAPAPDARFQGMRPWTAGGKFSSRGYGTYRMVLLLPPGREYGFRMQQQLTAYHLYANGRLKIRAGRAGTNRLETRPERKQHTFYAAPRDGRVEIVMHVANFHFFRGGLRGVVSAGERPALDNHVKRKIALDLILFGFFLAVFLYHLAFFITRPREISFGWFTLLCLSFALRVPLLSEKTINFFFVGPSWETHLRIVGTLNLVTPAILVLFLRSVFPSGISRRAVNYYLVASLPFLGVQLLDIKYLAPVMYLVHLTALLPALFHAALVTFRMSARGSRGALFMGLGIMATILLGLYAMYLNWRSEDPAPAALFTFATSVFFQSIGLAQTYRENMEAREKLSEGLTRSREALAAQRKDLEINLHDSLGGALTDFKVIIERGLEDPRDDSSRSLLTALREKLDRTNRMFRGQLLFMEDMELAAREPVMGLRMMLLRRYADAGRELNFEIQADASERLRATMNDDGRRMDLLQLCRELCTNDLKYGEGEAMWSMDLDEKNRLRIRQTNRVRASGDNQSDVRDVSAERARKRVRKMNGHMQAGPMGDAFTVTIVL